MAERDRYDLGIDLGSSFVAAAVNRGGRVELLPLGERSDVVSAAVGWQGKLVLGDAAERLSLREPDAVVRGLKSRVGDPIPLRFGGTSERVEALLVELLRLVATRARSRYGSAPSTVTLTHPAGWGPFRCDALATAARVAGLIETRLVTDPVAAASTYFTGKQIREGRLVGVYDFGGRSFQVTILRRTVDGFHVVGKPEGFIDLGGTNLDDRVFEFVRERAGRRLDHLDPETPDGAAALAVVRRDCSLAKERLSHQTSTAVLISGPRAGFVGISLDRPTFDGLVRRDVLATVESLGELLETHGVDPRSLEATLLVGGSSQIPLVSRLLVEKLGVQPAPAGHPKFAVPIGATIAARSVAAAGSDSEDSTKVVTKGAAADQSELGRVLKWWRRGADS